MIFYVDGIKYTMAGRRGERIVYRNALDKALYLLGDHAMIPLQVS